MSDTKADQAQTLRALINELTESRLDDSEVKAIVDITVEAQQDPVKVVKRLYGNDAARIIERVPSAVIPFILGVELEDYLVIADTVDELWEEVIDSFEAPQLPAFPYDDMPFEDVEGFYAWADERLAEKHPTYTLIEFGQHYNYEFQLVLANRDRIDTILELCEELDIEAERCI